MIGESLLDKYVLPFEIASVLLLVAMMGAIVLVRPEGATEEDRVMSVDLEHYLDPRRDPVLDRALPGAREAES